MLEASQVLPPCPCYGTYMKMKILLRLGLGNLTLQTTGTTWSRGLFHTILAFMTKVVHTQHN